MPASYRRLRIHSETDDDNLVNDIAKGIYAYKTRGFVRSSSIVTPRLDVKLNTEIFVAKQALMLAKVVYA